jgi:hypothetical protein
MKDLTWIILTNRTKIQKVDFMKQKSIRSVMLTLLVSFFLSVLAAQAEETRPLTVDGREFKIKGITYGVDFDASEIDAQMSEIRSLGANSIRTWGCGPETRAILDAAHKHSLKVMLGIWMRHGRPGAEGIDHFNYLTDSEGKAEQKAQALKWVKTFKDHPAVLCWGVGNEVGLNIATEEEKKAYAVFLEEVVREIKQVDPVHAVASVSAWTLDVPLWTEHCPSIDIYGINVYGYGAGAILDELNKLGARRPYVVTEFGPRGEWDAPIDKLGGKIEPGDAEKFETIAKGWEDMIEKNYPECLGGYVFNYGNGFDHTGLWLSLKVQGAYRAVYWATRQAFTGEKPENKPAEIEHFFIAKQEDSKQVGEWVQVMVKFEDEEKDQCLVSFAYNDRNLSWPDKGAVKVLESRPVAGKKNVYEFKVPEASGVLKIYALVRDPLPNLSSATQSIRVGKKT